MQRKTLEAADLEICVHTTQLRVKFALVHHRGSVDLVCAGIPGQFTLTQAVFGVETCVWVFFGMIRPFAACLLSFVTLSKYDILTCFCLL